jgi:hypothetical protein
MDARKVVVTLVCATADRESLDDVVDGLSATGRDVGIVAGVDEHPRRMGDAIDRCGSSGLVVLCTSARLDGPTLRSIEGLFSARRGPNHAMVRVDITQPPNETIAAIQRALDGFMASQGRVVRRQTTGQSLREVVGPVTSRALPAVRLTPGEEIEGDTRRIQLPDNPKSAELSRRRKAARERERERERITGANRSLTEADVDPSGQSGTSAMHGDSGEPNPDRMMILLLVGAGALAVLAALMFSGVF